MNLEIKVRDLITSDDSNLRSFRVKLANYEIQTPIKSITTTSLLKGNIISGELSNLSEHFIRFDEYSLKLYYSDKKRTDEINRAYNRHKEKLDEKTTTITIVEYRNKEPRDINGEVIAKIPNDEEIKMLINAAYSFSDITAIPSIPRVARKINLDNFPNFKNYLKKCYDRIQLTNKKKILGYIPMVAPLFIELLVEFYISLGINAFYVDFDGTTLNTNKSGIDALKRKLSEEGYEENHFLHYINISYGKAINEIGVLTARDLLAFGHGFDSLGGIHVPPKRGKGFYDWLKKQKDIVRNTTRILNKGDYGYYRYGHPGVEIEKIYPKDALFDLKEIIKKPSFYAKRRYFNIENIHQQALEAVNLRRIVRENGDKTIKYFKEKKNVKKEDIKLLTRK